MDLGAIEVFVGLGVISGFASGISGGGGPFSVALLVLSLPAIGVTGPELGRIAGATSVALIVPMAIRSFTAHLGRGSVDWKLAATLGPSLLAGTIIAAVTAPKIPPALLATAFTIFAAITVWQLFDQQTKDRRGMQVLPLTARGVIGGAFTALLGTGIGVIAIPAMVRIVPAIRAVGTNAVLALPLAVVSAAAYLAAPTACNGCIGYVYMPAVAAMGVSAVLAVPVGVWAAQIIPERTMRAVLAATLLIAAGNLLYRSVNTAHLVQEAHRFVDAIRSSFGGGGTPMAAGVPPWLQHEGAKP